jgi:hypothetical protein
MPIGVYPCVNCIHDTFLVHQFLKRNMHCAAHSEWTKEKCKIYVCGMRISKDECNFILLFY